LVLNKAGELLNTVKSRKLAYKWSHHEDTRELPGERDNARNNAMQVHAGEEDHASGLDGQHQYMDRTPGGRVSQNDRGQR